MTSTSTQYKTQPSAAGAAVATAQDSAGVALTGELTSLRERLNRLGLRTYLYSGDQHATTPPDVISLNDHLGSTLCIVAPPSVAIGEFRDTVLRMREEQRINEAHDEIVRSFSEKLIQSYEETHVLFRIIRFMTTSDDPFLQMQFLCNIVQQVLPFRWIGVVFRDDPLVTERLRGQVITSGCITDKYLLARAAREILDGPEFESWNRVLSPATHPLAAMDNAEVVHEAIAHDGSRIGLLVAGGKESENGEVGSPELFFLNALADFIGTYHENASRYSEQRAMSLGTLSALSAAIDAKDPYTRGHSERVAYLSRAIAVEMGMKPEEAEKLHITGLVHDIGKIGVPEAVLCKASRLSDEEFALIKRHPEIGCRILQGVPLLDHALPGVMHHHERFDGRGYPAGLAGEAIPMCARIIGLADAFDAMSSSRSYRSAMPREAVLEELTRCSGTHFAPEPLAAFLKLNLAPYDELLARQKNVFGH